MTRRMNAKKISKSILALLITVPALLATNAMEYHCVFGCINRVIIDQFGFIA